MKAETQIAIDSTQCVISLNKAIIEMTIAMPTTDHPATKALLSALRDYNTRCESYIDLLKELDAKDNLINHLCQLLLEMGLTPPNTKPTPN